MDTPIYRRPAKADKDKYMRMKIGFPPWMASYIAAAAKAAGEDKSAYIRGAVRERLIKEGRLKLREVE